MEDTELFRDVYKIASFVVSTIVLFAMGIIFYQFRWVLYLVGFICCACSVALIVEFTIRRVTRYTYYDISEKGTIAKPAIGKPRFIAPLGVTSTNPHKELSVKVTPVIPTIAEMLAKNLLDGVTLYLGYQVKNNEVVPVTGSFNSIRTFAILGKGGVGKTIRLFFILIQCILAHATIYLVDPHFMKPGSITRLLLPLQRWVRFAVPTEYLDELYRKNNPLTPEKLDGLLMAGVSEFRARMEKRVHGQETEFSPCVLVIDEFARMMYNEQYGETCVDTVVSCANQYRDYNGFSVVVMHEVVATNNAKTKNLVARLRRALHAIFVMRTDKDYAKFCLDGRWLKQVERLKTGSTIFIDTDGEIHGDVFTPKGSIADSYTLEKQMLELTGPTTDQLQLDSPRLKEQIAYPYRSTSTSNESVIVTPYTPQKQPLLGMPDFTVKDLPGPIEPGQTLTESFTDGKTFTEYEKQLVINAFHALALTKPGRITREDIKSHLGWNDRKHHIVKAVCDELGIATR